MSDRVVVMRAGAVEQSGTPADIYDFPRTAFVADFVGSANLVAGDVVASDAHQGTVAIRTKDGLMVHGVTHGRRVEQAGTISIRTVHLTLAAERPAGEVNVWPVEIKRLVFLGDVTQVHVLWGGQELVVRQIGAPPNISGEVAFLHAPPERCALLEASGS